MDEEKGTLREGEHHPAADSALEYVTNYLRFANLWEVVEAFSSTALSGNRLAEICHTTVMRLLDNKPVSDRYLLGLAWTIRKMEDQKKNERDRSETAS